MKEFFVYPVSRDFDRFGNYNNTLVVDLNSVGFFNEEVFIDSNTGKIEAGSKPRTYMTRGQFELLFGEMPSVKGRKIGINV